MLTKKEEIVLQRFRFWQVDQNEDYCEEYCAQCSGPGSCSTCGCESGCSCSVGCGGPT